MKKIAKVKLTPLKTHIKYEIIGTKIFCSRLSKHLESSKSLTAFDGIWLNIFRTKENIEKFLNINKPKIMKLNISKLGYDSCDYVIKKDKI